MNAALDWTLLKMKVLRRLEYSHCKLKQMKIRQNCINLLTE
jgi:hypothetical protein